MSKVVLKRPDSTIPGGQRRAEELEAEIARRSSVVPADIAQRLNDDACDAIREGEARDRMQRTLLPLVRPIG